MNRGYALVRPYPGALGDTIRRCVEELALSPVEAAQPIAGTSDERCAQWIARTDAVLVVVPFHMHRGGSREALDGVGILQHLPADFSCEGRVLFMPVRDFSWSASFQRRIDDLRSVRPDLQATLVVAHEDELGTPSLRAKLRRRLEETGLPSGEIAQRRSRFPGARSSGHWTFPQEIFSALQEERSTSSVPPSDSGRRSEVRLKEDDAPESEPAPGGRRPRVDLAVRGLLGDLLESKK